MYTLRVNINNYQLWNVIKSRIELYLVIFSVLCVMLFSFPHKLLSQDASPTKKPWEERLAVVSKYEGEVKVQHESIWKTIKQIGNRLRNSSIYEKDSVMTMHSSTANLVFNDNTHLEIEEDSSLTVSTREMSGEAEAEGGFIRKISGKHGGIIRNINIKAGKFLAEITPSKSVLTEFETPTGTASVRGTAFTLAYVGGVTNIDLTQGLLDFASTGDDVSFSVEPGDNINISIPEFGHTSIDVRAGQLDIATDTGTLIVESGESTGVEVDTDTGEVSVIAEEGTVDFETSTGTAVIEEGEVAGTSIDADTGAVTISSEDGTIEFETITGTATIEEGASAVASKDCTDTCSISLGAEDGTVEFETASGKVVIEDGEAAGTEVDEATGEVSVSSEGGVIGFKTDMGNVMMDEGEAIGVAVDAETGEVIMSADIGSVEIETEMGMASMQEGSVVEVVFDGETGDMTMSSSEGTYTLETDGGVITMSEGSSMDFEVAAGTGEITVSGINGDVTMINEAGTEITIEIGTSMGTHEAPVGSGPLNIDVPFNSETGIYDSTGMDNVNDDDNGEDFGDSDNNPDNDDYFIGTYDPANDTLVGSFDEGSFSYVFNEDGSIDVVGSDGNTLGSFDQDSYFDFSTVDFAQSSFFADESDADDIVESAEVITPTTWQTNETWTSRSNAYTDDIFGPISASGFTTPRSTTNAEFFDNFDTGGSDNFAVVHSGHGRFETSGELVMELRLSAPGTLSTMFDYNFIITEQDVFPITEIDPFNDFFKAELHLSDGTTVELTSEAVNSSAFTTVNGLPADTIDQSSGGQTGWIQFSDEGDPIDIPAGLTTLHFHASDKIDPSYDTAVLVDNIAQFFEETWVVNESSAWTPGDFAYTTNSFGPITAPGITTTVDTGTAPFFENFDNGTDDFAVIHTGYGDQSTIGDLVGDFEISTAGNYRVSFNYNFVTTEFTDSDWNNDIFNADLDLSNGNTIEMTYVETGTNSVLNSDLTLVNGLPENVLLGSAGSDSGSGGQTGWKLYEAIVYLTAGTTSFDFYLSDTTDDTEDSAALIDNVVYESVSGITDLTSSDEFTDDFSSGGFTDPQKAGAEAIISGSNDWNVTRNSYVDTSFGSNIIAEDSVTSNKFAIVHTGGTADTYGELTKNFNFTTSANRRITFDYNFVTTEFVDNAPNEDWFDIVLTLSDGSDVELAWASVFNSGTTTLNSDLAYVSGLPSLLDYSDADPGAGGQTGWISVDAIVYVPLGATSLSFSVFDGGDDGDTDSALLVDNVVDPIVDVPASTDYMLTFARMLSGDIAPHDADLEADAVVSEEHLAFIAKVNEVINDIENSSDAEFMAGKDEFFDRLWVARDHLADHEDTKEFMQETAVAHHLLEASIMSDESIGGNVAAIKDSLSQAKVFLVAHINDFGEKNALANIKTNIDAVLADIDNSNNNRFSTSAIAAIRDGIKQAFSDTIDHMNADGNHLCDNPELPCYMSVM